MSARVDRGLHRRIVRPFTQAECHPNRAWWNTARWGGGGSVSPGFAWTHEGDEPRDVPIELPGSTQMVARYEVFNADEATELFDSYYKTGDIPAGYSLRPIDGYATNGAVFDLRDRLGRL